MLKVLAWAESTGNCSSQYHCHPSRLPVVPESLWYVPTFVQGHLLDTLIDSAL